MKDYRRLWHRPWQNNIQWVPAPCRLTKCSCIYLKLTIIANIEFKQRSCVNIHSSEVIRLSWISYNKYLVSHGQAMAWGYFRCIAPMNIIASCLEFMLTCKWNWVNWIGVFILIKHTSNFKFYTVYDVIFRIRFDIVVYNC